MGLKKSWTDEQLKAAVIANHTIAGVIRDIGLKECGGNYVNIRKHIDRLKLDTSHFLGQKWSSNPDRRPPTKMDLTDIMVKNSSYPTSHLRKRLISEGIKDAKCEICSLTEWLGEPITLELDHINGVRSDHRLENLRVLCPNCHSYTPTWRGRNNSRTT